MEPEDKPAQQASKPVTAGKHGSHVTEPGNLKHLMLILCIHVTFEWIFLKNALPQRLKRVSLPGGKEFRVKFPK